MSSEPTTKLRYALVGSSSQYVPLLSQALCYTLYNGVVHKPISLSNKGWNSILAVKITQTKNLDNLVLILNCAIAIFPQNEKHDLDPLVFQKYIFLSLVSVEACRQQT